MYKTMRIKEDNMADMNETTILEDGDVKITNLRAIMGTKTYAMANVTSVNLIKKEPSNAPIWWAIVGGLLFLWGLTDFDVFGNCLLVGLILAGLGVYFAKNSKPTYMAKIGSASGETKLVGSSDKEQIQRIVDAVNEAIIRRG
jgi:hypothetical protein